MKWWMLGILVCLSCGAVSQEVTAPESYRDDLYYVLQEPDYFFDFLRKYYADIFTQLEASDLPFDDTGAIPDAKAAVDSALQHCITHYGVRMIEYTPFNVYFYHGAWVISGSLALSYDLRSEAKSPEGLQTLVSGPVPLIVMRQHDGQIERSRGPMSGWLKYSSREALHVWYLVGSLPKNKTYFDAKRGQWRRDVLFGGVPYVKNRQSDGTILGYMHTR